MKERPILFSAPMVRALLAGRKTQTRRIVKCPARTVDWIVSPERDGKWWPTNGDDYVGDGIACPYGAPGDRLWVRETCSIECVACNAGLASLGGCVCGTPQAVRYRADVNPSSDGFGWRPSIHMPRWASRITLEVTGVRVERLQDISGDDVMAEGVDPKPHLCGCEVCRMTSTLCPATQTSLGLEYADLWRDINGAESWDANPWVWVVEFRRVEPA